MISFESLDFTIDLVKYKKKISINAILHLTVERMFQNSFRRRNSACQARQTEAQRDSGGEEDMIH